jgi:hypothetical protein
MENSQAQAPRRGRPKKKAVSPEVPTVREALVERSDPPAVPARAKRGPYGPQKKPRPTTKRQVTVRVDTRLLDTAIQRAQKQNLTITDAIEAGLWLYLGDERPETTTQLRFLVSQMSLPMQKRVVSMAAFLVSKELTNSEERIRIFFTQVLDLFGQDTRHANALAFLNASAS